MPIIRILVSSRTILSLMSSLCRYFLTISPYKIEAEVSMFLLNVHGPGVILTLNSGLKRQSEAPFHALSFLLFTYSFNLSFVSILLLNLVA